MRSTMSLFGSFSMRAKRAIFLAHYRALKEGTREITPEHILTGLLKEDPELFALVMPGRPNLANELEHLLAADGETETTERIEGEELYLSAGSKEVVVAASEEQERLGHKSVGTQHLLLAFLVTPRRLSGWFRRGKRRNDSVAKQTLVKYGLSAASVEERIKEGIVTPLTWILDDSIIRLNAQFAAMVDLLISKGIFKRSDFVTMLDQSCDQLNPEVFLVPLIDALFEKGTLTASERERVKLLASASPSQNQPMADAASSSPKASNSGGGPAGDIPG
jgi:ClpA/ClpB-like protein